jgi:hypothetical protein
MKSNVFLKKAIIPVILVLSLVSCRKEKSADFTYYISGTKALSYNVATINSLINLATASYSGAADLKTYVSDDVDVYRLVYHTNPSGEEIEASGLVSTPVTPGEYPVLCFQNGTNTLYDYAPSVYPANPYYQLVEIIASMGFVVVIPDYPGFGTSENVAHPYLIREATVQSIKDMLRAVSEGAGEMFPGITIKNEYYLAGYSQGGWATAALHRALETDPDGEFNLAASVCGAGPYNMTNLFDRIFSSSLYPMPSYLCYILNAYKVYNQYTNPVTDLLRQPYASRLSALYNGTLSLDQINAQLNDTVAKLFTPAFVSGYASSETYTSLREALVYNSVTPWAAAKPLFLGHGDSDTHVNVETTNLFYNAMISAGTPVNKLTKVIYPGLDHEGALLPVITDGLKFLISIRDSEQVPVK